ncbi:Craniofacial development protein 1 [Dissophora globulifera]|nr:Craniofacial development protein 1 [Dissophora globulifera]
MANQGDIVSDGGEDSDDSDTEQQSYVEEDSISSTTRSGKRRVQGSPPFEEESSKRHKTDQELVSQAEAQSRKSKLDALWAEMNVPIVRPTSRPDISAAAALLFSSSSSSSTNRLGSSNASSSGSSSTKMVTITTTYEFAGETVTVTKDVPEDSKEAKEAALKNRISGGEDTKPIPATSASALGSAEEVAAEEAVLLSSEPPHDTILSTVERLTTDSPDPTAAAAASTSPVTSSSSSIAPGGPRITTRPSILDSLAPKKKGPVRYIRKKSILDELAATYGVKKPPKLNTLEKSKLDWNNFVGKEGIEDELKHHNKDGYMEKVAFLQRTDERRDREYQTLKKKR